MTLVQFDNASTGWGLRFADPERVIAAHEPHEVGPALAAIETARAAGRHVAGYLSYELGYALEPRLDRLQWPGQAGPLLWFGVFDAPRTDAPPPMGGRAYAGPLRPEWSARDYQVRFAAVKEAIAAGDIYQANLSFRSRFAFLGDARTLYRNLLARSAASHCAYIDFFDSNSGGTRKILSLSPELFFDLAADGVITARPMKGTWPRAGGDDEAERNALAASAKDRAENLMIVDLTRNDLGRIAEIGSVDVRELFAIETYPTLHAMVSTVTARARPGISAGEIVRALFPCGSITGAPKIRAMEIIRELESGPRGVYCGAIGHFSPSPPWGDGSARFNVAIRTITIEGNVGTLGIGGAVVQDSQSAAEYEECLVKARFFDAARKPLTLIETLRFENGFVRLAAHLARMKASAGSFGIAFDEAKAQVALEAAVAGKAGPLRVRLTLDEAGRFACAAVPLPPTSDSWTYKISPVRVSSADALARHKTDWRELYDAEITGADEMLFLNERGELAEGARTNIFIKRGDTFLTPPLAAGALDGRLRAELLAEGKAREAILTESDLADGEVFLGNSLRGLIRAVRA